MSLSDDELFLQEMADVSPLKQEHQSYTDPRWLNPLSVTDWIYINIGSRRPVKVYLVAC